MTGKTKIQLNVHHFDMPYFEWQRLMHYGLMQGNCIVTEVSSRVPHLLPGVHDLETDKDKIPTLVNWLLSTRDGQKKLTEVRLAGKESAINYFKLSRTLANLFGLQD